jgi:hypothetical protein
MTNYRTDGDVRYQQEVEINGIRIMVKWDTTAEYNKFNADYNQFLYLQSAIGHRDFDEEEEVEYNRLKEEDVENNSYYLNDETNNCDWDEPVDFEILD